MGLKTKQKKVYMFAAKAHKLSHSILPLMNFIKILKKEERETYFFCSSIVTMQYKTHTKSAGFYYPAKSSNASLSYTLMVVIDG